MIDERVFITTMTALSELFDKNLSDLALKTYYQTLSAVMDTEQFKKAIAIWIAKGKFFPKPAELIEIINQTEGSKVEKAWFEVMKEIEKKGIYGSPKFEDPIVYAVVEAMGGWEALCNMPVEKQSFYMREFENLYNAYKDQPAVVSNALPANREKERKAIANIIRKAIGEGKT